MSTITKRDLTARITNRIGRPEVTQQIVGEVIQLFIDAVVESLTEGNKVTLRRFGSFETRVRAPRLGRDPLAPETTYSIPARTTVRFNPSARLRDEVAANLVVPPRPPAPTAETEQNKPSEQSGKPKK